MRHAYDAVSLAKTILASQGPPCDPLTRVPLCERDLERLNTVLLQNGHAALDVRALLQRPQRTQLSTEQCVVELMEMRTAEVMESIFQQFELFTGINADEAYYHLYFTIMMHALPEMLRYLRHIADYDVDHAKHLVHSLVQRLRGPPNHPTLDPTHRILKPAILRLQDCLGRLEQRS